VTSSSTHAAGALGRSDVHPPAHTSTTETKIAHTKIVKRHQT
jgi:hypothetical protein